MSKHNVHESHLLLLAFLYCFICSFAFFTLWVPFSERATRKAKSSLRQGKIHTYFELNEYSNCLQNIPRDMMK